MPRAGTGVRQRLQVHMRKPRASPMLKHTVSMHATGSLSAAKICKLARASSFSGSDSFTKRLSKISLRQRHRRGKLQRDDPHASKRLRRALRRYRQHDGGGVDTYLANIDGWDEVADKKTAVPMTLLLVHAALERLIPEGAEEEWSTFGPWQQGFKDDLPLWASRVYVNLGMMAHWLAICLGRLCPFRQ